jgi:phospholipid/cholesterol/gamma-HCH transport system ATP-binding protein
MEDTKTAAAETTKTPRQVIEINNLSKGFADLKVLQNLSLQLFDGENLVVLGKSGSGKSVLIKCIVRLLNPDKGTITVLGENISELERKELATIREKVGFLFQSGALYDSMTIKQKSRVPVKKNPEKPFEKGN